MGTLMWYTWQNLSDFDLWHQQVIDYLDLPRVGVNSATGLEEPEKQKTVAYTATDKVAEGDYRAFISQQIAAQFPDHLGTPCDEPDWSQL